MKFFLSDYATKLNGVIVVAVIVVVGAMAKADIIDSGTKDTAVNLLLGFFAGGAIGTIGRRT